MHASGTPLTHIVKRNGTLVAYDRQRIGTAIGKALLANNCPNPAQADALALEVERALARTYTAAATPSVEDVQDVVEQVLLGSGLTRVAKSYIIYRHQRAQVRAGRSQLQDVADNIPYRKIYEVLRWNVAHECDSVANLNRLIARGRLPELIHDGDARYAQEIADAATRIAEHRDQVRIVILAGPSSSGKTTTTIKLREALTQAGLALKAINIDHYFFDLDQHPIDEFGDHDYETPQALDLVLINDHLRRLLDGATIHTPNYDFKSGCRTLDAHPLSLGRNEILLIDSLHGLYEGMTADIPSASKFRIYIETLGQFRAEDGSFMRWADNRLLRRMIRDRLHRNSGPMETLTHWHYVRRSELQYIIPSIKRTDTIINSALPYELPFLRHLLFRLIASARHAFRDDPRRLDAHIRANRVYDLLRPLRAVRDDACVPLDSLLREFIGGSTLSY